MQKVAQDDWDGTWPYTTHWLPTPEGRLAYIDEGPREGPPVVCLHGNPSWGYLYRAFVGPLVAAGHRVIVVDHLGFGRSDKPDQPPAYAIERHIARFSHLMETLALVGVTLVVHDWGGPIGLAWATGTPARVASLVLLNTFLHPPREALSLPTPLRLMRAPAIGAVLVKGLHAIVRGFLLGAGLVRPERLPSIVKKAYMSACPRWSARTAQLVFARAFPAAPNAPVAPLHAAIAARLPRLAHLPVLLLWGERDAIGTAACRAAFEAEFPRAETKRLPDAGHFVQEDAPEIVVATLLGFLGELPPPLRQPSTMLGRTEARLGRL